MLPENQIFKRRGLQAGFVTSQIDGKPDLVQYSANVENGLHREVEDISCPAVKVVKWTIFAHLYILDFLMRAKE